MRYTLQLFPPVLTRWLPAEVQDRAIVLFDVEFDVLPPRSVRFDLNVILNYVAIRRKTVRGQADFYVGCTGARIEVEARNGQVSRHSGNQELDVTYTNTVSRKRTSSLSLAPKVSSESPTTASSVEIGEVAFEAGKESTFESKYTGSECYLAATCFGGRVRWDIVRPRGERVVQDFLSGNLHLFAECRCNSPAPDGFIRVVPLEVLFFDPERRPMRRLQSLIMEYVLWRRGIRLVNVEGSIARFNLLAQG